MSGVWRRVLDARVVKEVEGKEGGVARGMAGGREPCGTKGGGGSRDSPEVCV